MERRTIAVQGTVQGVGFRPYVFGLASRLALGGFVRNDAGGVTIEVEGECERLDQFFDQLLAKAPPLARIDEVSWHSNPARGDRKFSIEQSDSTSIIAQVRVSPDVATCDDCLRDLFDSHNRRYRHPFINCTNCGPRLTVMTGWPYDRKRTTMAPFDMCDDCRAEYENPTDRRFHAQPIACPKCGPRLSVLDAEGQPVETEDPISYVAEAIRAGKVAAIKGLGGYHLACDAQSASAVRELRKRKRRDEKPFAVMTADAAAASTLCRIGQRERQLLTSPERPIVLLARLDTNGIDDRVAPDNPLLGVMLAYTPVHHLLLHQLDVAALVMTSGNRCNEPIAIDEADAVDRLKGIADLFLINDRPIHVRCDDSVTRTIGDIESPVRRSRGYAPRPVSLPIECPGTILAVGGQMKATFAMGKGRRAIVSHHLGDLDDLRAFKAFENEIALYEKLFAMSPACIAHDLHPDYASTAYALRRHLSDDVETVAVQHHHAHMASCMAENQLSGPVIGVTFDGTGFGNDGAIWGGEFLVGDFAGFKRAAHLRYVAMPGSEAAVREPWRMAASYLLDAGANCEAFDHRVEAAPLRTIRTMVERKINSPMTSSAGRFFDAVAALVGLNLHVSFEGQAAMRLESLANQCQHDSEYPFMLHAPENDDAPVIIDTRPTVAALARDVDGGVQASRIARRFHTTLAAIVVAVCTRIRSSNTLNSIVLSGGVFMNALLTIEVKARLEAKGFDVYLHHLLPPNDGGLCLGQLAVAASRLSDAISKR